MLVDLSKRNSLIGQFLSEIRNKEIQNDRMRFRRNMERIGEIIAYEISKELDWVSKDITTPLGVKTCYVLKTQPVLATILRAGISLHLGLLNFFDHADNAFISAYRKHADNGDFTIKLGYLTCPPLEGKHLIISDPMLASGSSMVATLKQLFEIQQPVHTHIVVAIAARQGIEMVRKNLSNFTIWAAGVDEELDANSYIVPGLGDAGDLAYGEKIQN